MPRSARRQSESIRQKNRPSVFMKPKKRGAKFVVLLSFVALFLILEIIVGYVQKSIRPKLTTPQQVAQYIYKGEPEFIVLGKSACFIFNRFLGEEADYLISPCIDGSYEIGAKIQSNFIAGKSQLLYYIDFLQAKGSDDQYVVVVGRGYQNEITVCDNKRTDWNLFFNEEQVEGTEYAPYFFAIGYLDDEDLNFYYTVTVKDSNASTSLTVKRQEDGSFVLQE